MIVQQRSNEELCNLLVQGLVARDEKILCKVLEQQDENTIKDVITRLPVNYVRKLLIELGNLLSNDLNLNHLTWTQHLLALKYSVISTMADGRSILLPIISLLEDRSNPDYYNKVQGLKGKLTLLKQLKEARRGDSSESFVNVEEGPDVAAMEIESETDTESEEDLEDENIEEDDQGDEDDIDDGVENLQSAHDEEDDSDDQIEEDDDD